MKKLILLTLFFTISLTTINAQVFNEYIPGGINYINPENVSISSDGLHLINQIKVKPNTYYTLTFPGFDYLENVYLFVEGNLVYFDDTPDTYATCKIDTDITSCTFYNEDEFIDITIYSPSTQMYYNYYQLENYQLEEGQQFTAYEEYIAPLIDTQSPTFSGSGGYITSYDDVTLLSSIISNHIVAVDEVDGDLSNRIVIETDNYTNNEQIVGEYDVLLSVTDNSANKAYFNLTILVKDQIKPVIECEDIIQVDVNNQQTITNIIQDNVLYYDGYDQNPVFTILFDGYSSNEGLLGRYPVEVKVEDTYGNTTIKQFHIDVLDLEVPIVTSDLQITENINNPKTITELINQLVVTDNYDNNPLINVVSDGYTSNTSQTGTYFVEIEVSDFSGNKNNYTLEINLVDIDLPIIEGPNTISFSYENPKTIEEIINMYTVSDNYTSLVLDDIFIKLDDYSNRESTIGEYNILIAINDEAGNETTKSISISVYDDVVPLIFVDEYIIVLEQGSSFTTEDALKLLQHNNQLENKEYKIEVLKDEYTGNELIEGRYIYELRFTDNNGTVFDKEFIVDVQESNQKTPINYRYYSSIGTILLFSTFVLIKKRK